MADVDVAMRELQFHRERLATGSDAVTSIGNYIFLLVGVGAVAASRVPEAVVLVALFWSAWLLHAMQRAWDSMKHEVYAVWLEGRISASLGEPVPTLRWNSVSAHRDISTPFISRANFVYWLLLNLGSWIVSVWVFADEGHELGAYAIAGLGVAVYAAVLATILGRDKAVATLHTALGYPAPAPDTADDQHNVES